MHPSDIKSCAIVLARPFFLQDRAIRGANPWAKYYDIYKKRRGKDPSQCLVSKALFHPPSFSSDLSETTTNRPQSIMAIITAAVARTPSFTKETLGTFSGDVYFNHLHKDEHISILDVQFSPCARTHWHGHEKGQLLEITTGSGWVCDKGQEPRRVEAGDVVWCPPGTVHWHGADEGSSMVHRAISFGSVDWHNPVSESDLEGTR